MKKYGFVNDSQLAKVMKKADMKIYGMTDDNMLIVCNSYFVVKIYPDMASATAKTMLSHIGRIPKPGECFRAYGPGDVSEFSMEGLLKFFDGTGTDVYDTKLLTEYETGKYARLYDYRDGFVILNDEYSKMINECCRAYQVKPGRASAVTFERDNEKAVILPMNVRCPEYVTSHSEIAKRTAAY